MSGFRVLGNLGFWGSGFRVLGNLGFWGSGFRFGEFRVLGVRV